GKSRAKGNNRGQSAQGNNKVICQICAKGNHDASICWYMYDSNPSQRPRGHGHNPGYTARPPQDNPYPRPSAHLAIPQYYIPTPELDTASTSSWIPDSGAS
ncbi:retrovirus-related pol polyprotein from transposon TNT 1-94, partial [Trifolium medium]|nr:retrovirus-related pol polyprotein from transposon TNT 1-94 [Trifolium medium]